MALNKRILLFGDQTVDVHPEIKHLFQESKRSLKLQSFLQNACDVLHVELEKLNTIERERFQIFHSILDLAELHKHGDLDIVISTTLLTIVQLGSLILSVFLLVLTQVFLDCELIILSLVHRTKIRAFLLQIPGPKPESSASAPAYCPPRLLRQPSRPASY